MPVQKQTPHIYIKARARAPRQSLATYLNQVNINLKYAEHECVEYVDTRRLLLFVRDVQWHSGLRAQQYFLSTILSLCSFQQIKDQTDILAAFADRYPKETEIFQCLLKNIYERINLRCLSDKGREKSFLFEKPF